PGDPDGARLAEPEPAHALPGRRPRATRAQGGVAVRDAGQARGLPRAHRLSGLRDQPRAVSLAVAELGGAADACGASVSGESGQWLAVSALRARSKGYAVSRLRPGDAG